MGAQAAGLLSLRCRPAPCAPNPKKLFLRHANSVPFRTDPVGSAPRSWHNRCLRNRGPGVWAVILNRPSSSQPPGTTPANDNATILVKPPGNPNPCCPFLLESIV